MSGSVVRLPKFLRPRNTPAESMSSKYAGYDPQLECLMACVEELNILESKKGPAVRRQTIEWLQERYALEDRLIAERAQGINE